MGHVARIKEQQMRRRLFERDHLKDIDVDGTVMAKQMLGKQCVNI
jgi:hypothetical protein